MNYLTTRDVAKRLNMNPRLIRSHITSGSLRATKLGKEFRVSEQDLEDFVKKGYQKGEEK